MASKKVKKNPPRPEHVGGAVKPITGGNFEAGPTSPFPERPGFPSVNKKGKRNRPEMPT